MKEIWKDVVGYEGLYEVSNLGRIKSLARENCNHRYEDIIRKISSDNNGYSTVTLSKSGKVKTLRVHQLVLNAFVGKSNLECNHKNGIKNDNQLENLEWVTSSENTKHAYKKGLLVATPSEGSKNGRSKLKNDLVIAIKKQHIIYNLPKGYWSNLAKILEVHPLTIARVLHNKNWKHL